MEDTYAASPFAEAYVDTVGWPEPELEIDDELGFELDDETDEDPDADHETGWRSTAMELPWAVPVEGEIFGKHDNRLRVGSTLQAPHRWICHIETWVETAREHGRNAGTGILVGPRHLLTAAHNLYSIVKGQATRPTKMRVVPARDGNRKPFGETWAATSGGRVVARVRKGWYLKRNGKLGVNLNRDFALVLLEDELLDRTHQGIKLGYWGTPPLSALKRLDPAEVRSGCVTVTGYPEKVEKPWSRQKFEQATQWEATGRLRGISSKEWRCVYWIDSGKGQSGGPVWLWRDGKAHLLAVHSGPPDPTKRGTRHSKNGGVRVTRKMMCFLTYWAQQWDKGVKEAGEAEMMEAENACKPGTQRPLR